MLGLPAAGDLAPPCARRRGTLTPGPVHSFLRHTPSRVKLRVLFNLRHLGSKFKAQAMADWRGAAQHIGAALGVDASAEALFELDVREQARRVAWNSLALLFCVPGRIS
jgi:hypothetical protein